MNNIDFLIDVIKKYPESTKTDLAVLVFLMSKKQKNNLIEVSFSEIAKEMNLSDRFVKKQMTNFLIKNEIVQIYKKGDRTKPNTYILNFKNSFEFEIDEPDCYLSSIDIVEKLQPMIANVLYSELSGVKNNAS